MSLFLQGKLLGCGVLVSVSVTALVLSACPVVAQEKPGTGAAQMAPLGFVDENGDGVNDRFVDANGDGINDVTKQPYPHRFRFQDADGDGINDLWVDADGDGVNDLIIKVEFGSSGPKWIDVDGDGIQDRDVTVLLGRGRLWHHVLDFDHDGKNDVTGILYRGRRGIQGFRFGIVDEEVGNWFERFLDRDHDGMHDEALKFGWRRALDMLDFFIDRDGDGICDDRTIGLGKGRARGSIMRRGKGRP